VLVRLVLFWSSYAPLFLLLAVRFSDLILRAVMAVLFVGGALALIWVVRGRSRELEADPYELAEVRDEGAAVAAYLASYILPIATVADPSATDLVAYAIFLVMLAVVSVRTDLAQVNPLLYLAGYRVFAIRTVSGMKGYLICNREPVAGDRLKAVSLTDDVLKLTGWLDEGGAN
jgi:hypothetical protein